MRGKISTFVAMVLLVMAALLCGGVAWADEPPSGIAGDTGSTATWTYYEDTNTIVIGGGSSVTIISEFGADPFNYAWSYIPSGTFPKIVVDENTNTVELIGVMSYLFEITDISELALSKFDVSQVTSARYMFSEATGVSEMSLRNWDLRQCEGLDYMISRIDGLVSIDLTGVQLPQSAYFSGMIVDNDDLTTVYASAGTDWSSLENLAEDGGDIFYCGRGGKTILPNELFTNAGNDDIGYYNPKLVGGAGTRFSLDKVGMQYDKIDGLGGAPGYLTSSAPADQIRSRIKMAKAAYVNVSADGMDIPANEYWTTEAEKAALVALVEEAEALTGEEDEAVIADVLNRLNAAIDAYEVAKKAGKAPSAFTVNSEKSPTYNAYRLFKGSVDNVDGKNVMSGITLDPSVNGSALKTFLISKGYTGDENAQSMAEFIANKITEDAGDASITADAAFGEFIEFWQTSAEQFALNYPNGDYDPSHDYVFDWINGNDLYDAFLEYVQDDLYDWACGYGYTGDNDIMDLFDWLDDLESGLVQPTIPTHVDTVNAEGFPIVNSDAFAMDLAKWVKDNVQPVTSVQAGNRLQGEEGYYLLINQSVPANWAGTAPIWVPLGGQPVEITEKVSVPTLNKQVRENSTIDPVVENWKSRGTGVVANLAYVNEGVVNMSFGITGMDPDNPVKPVSVTTRFGIEIPLTEDGTFEKSFTVSGWDGGPGSIVVGEPTETLNDGEGGIDHDELINEMFFQRKFFGGGFEGSYSGLGEVGDAWIITYSDGSTLSVYPDGQLDQTTLVEYEPRQVMTNTIMFGDNTDKWRVTAPLNDPRPADPSWGKAADAQMEEKVSYKLTATLPSNYSSFEDYNLKFEDIIPMGIHVDENSVRIKVVNGDGQNNVADITELVKANGGGVLYASNRLKVVIDDLKAVAFADKGIVANSHIVVEYEASLTTVADTGTTPNTNSATLTYSADPVNLTEIATTLPSTANLYTYEVLLIKVDANTAQQLEDAEFTIMRDGKYVQYDGALDTTPYVLDTSQVLSTLPIQTITLPVVGFHVRGFDAGTYTITEVTPPSGYDPLSSPLTLTITRDLDQQTGAISNLAVTMTGGPAGTSAVLDTVTDGTTPVANVIVLTVPNTKELVFPITGLSGNAVFYAIAGLLALIAIIGFVASRRNTKNKKRKAVEKDE